MSSDRQQQLKADISRKRIDLEKLNDDLDTVRGSFDEGRLTKQVKQLLNEIENLEDQLNRIVLRFPAVSNFDLQNVVGICLNEIIDKKELVGFSMGCSESHFLDNFSERLEIEWGRATTRVVRAPSLNPLTNEANWTSREVLRLRKLLEVSNIVYLVRICVSDPTSDLAREFWLRMQKEFQGTLNNCLMIMMVSDQDCLLPSENVISLSPPQFQRSDLYRWFSEITEETEWQDARKAWICKMENICSTTDSGYLDFFLIYSNLKSTLGHLQREPSLEKFLQFVDLLVS
jgi:hypothetical protein